jgi:hypothetical protein
VGFDHSAPRRPVNLRLNSDLVERCKSEVGNLFAHVEELLAADLEKRAAAAEAESSGPSGRSTLSPPSIRRTAA